MSTVALWLAVDIKVWGRLSVFRHGSRLGEESRTGLSELLRLSRRKGLGVGEESTDVRGGVVVGCRR